jgi:hypothetical protein
VQSGPSLQGLNGRLKRGVPPNELRTARRDAAGERLHTTIKHLNTCVGACQDQKTSAGLKKHQQPRSPSTSAKRSMVE